MTPQDTAPAAPGPRAQAIAAGQLIELGSHLDGSPIAITSQAWDLAIRWGQEEDPQDPENTPEGYRANDVAHAAELAVGHSWRRSPIAAGDTFTIAIDVIPNIPASEDRTPREVGLVLTAVSDDAGELAWTISTPE